MSEVAQTYLISIQYLPFLHPQISAGFDEKALVFAVRPMIWCLMGFKTESRPISGAKTTSSEDSRSPHSSAVNRNVEVGVRIIIIFGDSETV